MASLSPANITLDLRLAKHLMRRTTFYYHPTGIDTIVGMSSDTVVDSLFNNTTNALPHPLDFNDGNWTIDEGAVQYDNNAQKKEYVAGWWFYNAMKDISIRHKMTFFLYTTFTATKQEGKSSHLYDYLRLLDNYALGSYKELANKITIDNLMLIYLDNYNNDNDNPNENYAREFLELFTIGKGPQISADNYTTYTEQDVVEAAKVLTGYKVKPDRQTIDTETNLPSGFINTNKHDTTDKTFSSAFNNTVIQGGSTEAEIITEHQNFVNMIFDQDATAKNICRKLYRYFVHHSIDEEIENDIITPLAQQLKADDYNMINILKTLLKSQHFYDLDDGANSDEIIGGIIKSPLQQATEIISFFDMSIPDPLTQVEEYYDKFFKKFVSYIFLSSAGMTTFSPNTVAGYPAYYQEPDYDKLWFTSSTIIPRYKLMESFTSARNQIVGNTFLIYGELNTPEYLKNQSFINDVYNPEDVIDSLVDYLFPEPIDSERRSYFLNDILLDNYPNYYWADAWSAYLNSDSDTIIAPRLNALFNLLLSTPESQLL